MRLRRASSVGRRGRRTGTVGVTAATGCAWTGVSNASWITVTSGASGSGPGTVAFSVAANTGAARTGTLTIAGQTFTVTQAAPCTYAIASTSQSVAAGGTTGTVGVTAATGCAWTGVSNASWITVTSGASGSGPGTVAFSVAANTGAARTGTLTIAGQTFTVTQAAPCTSAIASNSSVGRRGRRGEQRRRDAPARLQLVGDVERELDHGDQRRERQRARHGGVQRGGQHGGGAHRDADHRGPDVYRHPGGAVHVCDLAGESVDAGSGRPRLDRRHGVRRLHLDGGQQRHGWLTVTSGASGSGPGTVAFSVAANTGAARTGTLTIAGQTFTVTQAAPCTYAIAPGSQSVVAGGGTGSTAVTAPAGCAWTGVSNNTSG